MQPQRGVQLLSQSQSQRVNVGLDGRLPGPVFSLPRLAAAVQARLTQSLDGRVAEAITVAAREPQANRGLGRGERSVSAVSSHVALQETGLTILPARNDELWLRSAESAAPIGSERVVTDFLLQCSEVL
jgi:hypothetical protein